MEQKNKMSYNDDENRPDLMLDEAVGYVDRTCISVVDDGVFTKDPHTGSTGDGPEQEARQCQLHRQRQCNLCHVSDRRVIG